MENLSINNLFMGFLGAMNVNLPDEQSACQENSAKDFLTILNNIMDVDCLMSDATGAEKDIATPQPSALDSFYPVLLNLIQNISNVNIQKGKEADDDNRETSRYQRTEQENNDSIEIDLLGMDDASINAILPLLNSIAGVLNKSGKAVKLDIVEAIYKYVDKYNVQGPDAQNNTCDDIVLISSKNRTEYIEENRVVEFSSDESAVVRQKEKTVMPVGHQLMDDIMTMPVVSDESAVVRQKEKTVMPVGHQLMDDIMTMPAMSSVYFKAEQVAEKKGEGGGNAYIPPTEDKIPTEYFVLGKSNKESDMYSMPVHRAKKELPNEADDNAEILLRDIPHVIKQGSNRDREVSFRNYQQIDLDIRNAQSKGKENGIQVLFAQGEKLLDESTVKQKEGIAEPQSKDLKLMFKDNNYLSYSRPDRFENPLVQEVQNQKGVSGASFSSFMTDKIEKIIEQYAAKGTSMDMVVRLKIEDSETLLVGLKNEGQKVMVDVKTTSGGIINILQAQKDVIARNLEEKSIYTNIFIDPESNGNFERREARQENQRNNKNNGKQRDFIEFLETV